VSRERGIFLVMAVRPPWEPFREGDDAARCGAPGEGGIFEEKTRE